MGWTVRKLAVVAVVAIACVAIGAALGGAANIHWKDSAEIGSVDLITIVLSALSVMLAILTIFLAIFALIGWAAINRVLREHSMNYFTNELKQGKPAFELLRTVVRGIVYEGITPVDDDTPYAAENAEDQQAEG